MLFVYVRVCEAARIRGLFLPSSNQLAKQMVSSICLKSKVYYHALTGSKTHISKLSGSKEVSGGGFP